jgi:uncharacterized membrane protein required for colicin V production
MSKRDALEIAVKIFALYCVVAFFASIPNAAMAFAADTGNLVTNRALFLFLSCLHPVLYLVLAIVFLSKGQAIAAALASGDSVSAAREEHEKFPPYTQLYFWITVIGLYYLVSASTSLASDLVRVTFAIRNTFWWMGVVSNAMTLAVALIFTLKSKKVAEYVERFSDRNT